MKYRVFKQYPIIPPALAETDFDLSDHVSFIFRTEDINKIWNRTTPPSLHNVLDSVVAFNNKPGQTEPILMWRCQRFRSGKIFNL